ncbi:Hypothetical predicted protein [Mytilus galloprovincialis]|uniref:G-protein coupled receptors family 2 profile 2 domain-containing protein n=1 Tax=Mytilus galloprovincialis TaxID=29158 RepID=A0A8B6CQH1_MYTGA|nr:Hypothetical predicted protein [Mytilus galloprovincialis]
MVRRPRPIQRMKSVFFSSVVPAGIVGISASVTKLKGYGNDQFCWLSLETNLIWAFIGPALLVILINVIVTIIAVYKLMTIQAHAMKTLKEKLKIPRSSLQKRSRVIEQGVPVSVKGQPKGISHPRGSGDGSKSQKSSSASSSSELGGGGGAGRRALRRRIQGRKQKGKSNSKEKCKKYERLEALIKETCICSFPNELVGRSYQYFLPSPIIEVYTFYESYLVVQREEKGTLMPLSSMNCIEKNGDLFMVREGNNFICVKFTSTDSLKPQAHMIGLIEEDTGTPSICDVCARLLFPSNNILFRDPPPLPVGCSIPIGCPLTTFGTSCTSTPSITLDGFCSELLEIIDDECPESSESSESSSDSSSIEVEGGGRRDLRRHMKGRKQIGWKQKGRKPKGKNGSKEKCKKYEELEALIKETCE